MEDLFGIDARRKAVADNIQKALGAGYEANPETPENAEENIQKGRVGVYEDNAENRRLNRVGQQYGKKKEEEQPKGKVSTKKEDEPSDKKGASEKQDMSSHAAKASDGALKRAAADENASEDVRNAAKEELKKRGGGSEDNNYFTEDGLLNKENPTVKKMLELDKKLGEHPDKNSDEYKEYASLREKLDYEVYKNNNEKFAKMFPNMKENTLSFEEWKDRLKKNQEKWKKEEEKEAKEKKKQEDFDDISSDIDSIAYYMADNPEEDESGNKYEYKDGDIQNEVVKEFGVKISKLVEKYGKGNVISLIAKNSETFDRIRARRLVNACLKSE